MKEISRKTCELCGDEFTPNGRQTKRCFKEHWRTCGHCGETFLLTPLMPATRTYCSKACSLASRRKPPKEKICVICETPHTTHGKTCSYACAAVLRGKTYATQVRTCAYCGREFTPSSSTSKWCEGPHRKECAVCHEEFEFTAVPPGPKTCSSTCLGILVNSDEANEKRRETSQVRYGVDFSSQAEEVKRKIVATNLERYGVESPLASKELRDKGRATTKERYGVEWYSQSKEGKAARAATNRERYGAENPFASEEIKEKIRTIWLEKYGVPYPMMNPTVVAGVKATNLARYGVPNVLMVPEIQAKARETFSLHINNGVVTTSRKVSKLNREWAEFLEERLAVKVTLEKAFGKFSADLAIEGTDLLVDLHPTISHNQVRAFGCVLLNCPHPCHKHSPLPKAYHFHRAQEARKEGYRLLQWYGWETKEALARMIEERLRKDFRKYSARKCTLFPLTSQEANTFLQEAHYQGGGRGQKHCYGLSREGELLAVATFGPARFGAHATHEFIRYAVKPGVVVHGGAGRLFRHFLEEEAPEAVISYVDFNHSTAPHLFLSSLGFREMDPTGPAVVWHRLADDKHYSESSVVAQGVDRLLGTSYGSREACGLGNGELLLLEGFLPVATAGNRRFLWRREW